MSETMMFSSSENLLAERSSSWELRVGPTHSHSYMEVSSGLLKQVSLFLDCRLPVWSEPPR